MTRTTLVSAATTRRTALLSAYRAIQQHERRLAETMIRGLLEIPGLKLYGIADPAQLDRRCPTFAVRIAGRTPLQLATALGDRGQRYIGHHPSGR